MAQVVDRHLLRNTKVGPTFREKERASQCGSQLFIYTWSCFFVFSIVTFNDVVEVKIPAAENEKPRYIIL